jgi:hypothetical protein
MRRVFLAVAIFASSAACAAVLGLTDPALDEDANPSGDAANGDGGGNVDGDGASNGDASDDAESDGGVEGGRCMQTCDGGVIDTCTSATNCGSCGRICDRGCLSGDCKEFTVFVTSTASTGDLQGIAGADARCKALALNAPNQLRGSYRAWLSINGDPAGARLRHGTRPYVLVDGNVVAKSWDDLVSGTLEKGIAGDEKGAYLAGTEIAWTGTLADGGAAISPHCQKWSADAGSTGRVGGVTGTDSRWTDFADASCSGNAHLYCFEQ